MSSTEAPSTREQPATKAASGGENNSSALNAEYQAEDTDIILRSSDGLDFKVHKWALMGSSKVFHGMLTVGNNEIGATIELMDEKIEHSRNIKSFLDLAYSKSMIKFALNGDDRNPSSDLIDFLLKYEATYPLLWLKAALKAFIAYNDIGPLDMFIVGAQLDSIDICIAAIRCESNIDWADGQAKNAEISSGISGRHVLDLTAMPLSLFKIIPDRYSWSLIRACSILSPKGNIWYAWRQKDANKWMNEKKIIAKEFEKLMVDFWWVVHRIQNG